MRVAFTGSRHFSNEEQVRKYIRELQEAHHSNLQVAHGDSKGGGVDLFVKKAVADLEIVEWPFPVRSGKTGIDGNHRGAPLNRNKRMLMTFQPDLLVAFRAPGKSNGTDHCVREAQKLGIRVEIIEEEAV